MFDELKMEPNAKNSVDYSPSKTSSVSLIFDGILWLSSSEKRKKKNQTRHRNKNPSKSYKQKFTASDNAKHPEDIRTVYMLRNQNKKK